MKKWIKYIIVAAAVLFVVGLIIPELSGIRCRAGLRTAITISRSGGILGRVA